MKSKGRSGAELVHFSRCSYSYLFSKQITNVRVLRKHCIQLLHGSCRPAQRTQQLQPPGQPVQNFATTKATSPFYSSELITHLPRFQLVPRTCISVCPSPGFPFCCWFHVTASASGRELLVSKRMFSHMALPQTPGSTCIPGKASPDTGWPWKAKCHFKFANASCHHFWARPKPWSEPSPGSGEAKFEIWLKCGASSLSCAPATSEALRSALLAHTVCRQSPGPLAKGAWHRPAPQQPRSQEEPGSRGQTRGLQAAGPTWHHIAQGSHSTEGMPNPGGSIISLHHASTTESHRVTAGAAPL